MSIRSSGSLLGLPDFTPLPRAHAAEGARGTSYRQLNVMACNGTQATERIDGQALVRRDVPPAIAVALDLPIAAEPATSQAD